MPIYVYQYTDTQGGGFEEFQHMREAPLEIHEGRPCRRAVTRPSEAGSKFGEGNDRKPIEMMSIALDTHEDISDFRKRNPGVEISSDIRSPKFGIPIATSRSEKLRILKNEGFEERGR